MAKLSIRHKHQLAFQLHIEYWIAFPPSITYLFILLFILTYQTPRNTREQPKPEA